MKKISIGFREPEHGAIDGKWSRASRAESRGKAAPGAISAPTRPRIVIDPASGLINPLSIFNSVMLIRAFPRRLTLRAACGNVDSLVPTRLTLRAALRQSPVQPPGCLGPSGCPAAWLPAPLCPISPSH